MPEGKAKVFDWRGMPDKAQQILGDDFWYEINRMMPKQGPPVDMYRTADQVVVVMEAPGLASPDKLSIRIKGMKLHIIGEILMNYPVTEEDLLQKERFHGNFKRELVLPDDVISTGPIDAQFKGGLLEIHIPRLMDEEEQEVSINFNE